MLDHWSEFKAHTAIGIARLERTRAVWASYFSLLKDNLDLNFEVKLVIF